MKSLQICFMVYLIWIVWAEYLRAKIFGFIIWIENKWIKSVLYFSDRKKWIYINIMDKEYF